MVALSKRNAAPRNVAAATVGNALEFYDFTVYAAYATTIARVFFPVGNSFVGLLLSVATFGLGFLARPLGAVIIGIHSDRRGRKAAMSMTIWMMALGSLMIAVLPGYDRIGVLAPLLLVVARLVQGFSTGGEMGPATAFLVESATARRIALAGSWQIASQQGGTFLSGLVGLMLGLSMSPAAVESWGWRVPFLLGVLIAPVGYWIRHSVDETLEHSVALDSAGAVARRLLHDMPGRVGAAILIVAGATVAQYFFLYGTTYAIRTLHFPADFARTMNLVLGGVGLAFALAGGWLADRHGARAVVVAARLAMAAALYPGFMVVMHDPRPGVFLAVLAMLMVAHGIASGAAIVLLTGLFPMEVRTLGTGLSYALGVTIFGGTAQLVFTALIGLTGSPMSWLFYIVAVSVVSVAPLLSGRMARIFDSRGDDVAAARMTG
ncbi:MFS transporter [Gluconacetobacter azotocaptans]|uniref:MFS transporter n=1 Tax=Gluconacetobacter azotocaptans TaxID=142834 RepID=A0A7W4JPG5_9PROT|nr:MFS transporter [Gluconacetobacter azotocaptans]MBB2188511.1 MFS transporter [Gluconacetobacter azotocaptans]GBQ28035.1 major facilitator superfamily alpha-ketoglutarate/sugar transporter [Gluconacetobacter azotocaptans DSM 13594]